MIISALRSAMFLLLLLVGTSASSSVDLPSWASKSRSSEPLNAEQVFTVAQDLPNESTPAVIGSIAPGHYIYRASLKAEDASGNAIALKLPPGQIHEDEFFGKTEVYESPSVRIGFADLPAKDVTLHWQGCAMSGICYPPQQLKLTVAQTSTAQSFSEDTHQDFSAGLSEEQRAAEHLNTLSSLTSAAMFFGFGLLLAFTPCSLPMIPIVSTIVVGGASPRRALILASVYTVSMALVYALVGIAAGLLGANLQAALQTPWVLSAFAALFTILAASLFGVFELRLPASLEQRVSASGQGAQRGSLVGAALLGLLSALLVGPCMTAPLAGAMLYVGQNGSAAVGGIALFMLGVGMGVPLVLISAFGSRFLPKPGPWMERVRTAFGYVMLAMAVLMLSRFIPAALSLALWGSLLIALAAGVFRWAEKATALDSRAIVALRTIALVSGAWGLLVLAGAATGGQSLATPLSQWNTRSTIATTSVNFIEANSASAVDMHLAQAGTQGQWTLIDFYADWCISCHVNEQNVLKAPAVVARLSKMQVLRPDVTANDAIAKELMQRWGVQGPPTIVLVGPDGKERRAQRLIGELSEQQFMTALDAAGA